jgi:hypothetical protein
MHNMAELQLVPLSPVELNVINGGSWWEKKVKSTLWYEVFRGIADNWEEVKAQFVNGWNIDKPKN